MMVLIRKSKRDREGSMNVNEEGGCGMWNVCLE